jgi:hypothetical protein
MRNNLSPGEPLVPKVFVIYFTGGWTARVTILNINVLSVVSFTLHYGVIFVPNSPPLAQPPLLPNHALPTPVQIEKLRPLLCGYDSVLTSILYSGFKFDFPLHFRGVRVSLLLIILFLPNKTLR